MNRPSDRAANPFMAEPFMGDDFARVYEHAAHRLTSSLSTTALDMVGSIVPGARVLDIAAGAGALSVPAAQRGAAVLATDVAPGMVKRLSELLRPFPACSAQIMDGESLDCSDASFDAAFSIFGAILFSDFRRGLAEQARAVRPGGKGCVATWRDPPGGGPFQVMGQAMRSTFPDRGPPPQNEGFIALSDPDRLAEEMRLVGFDKVEIEAVERVWEGPTGAAYVEDMRELHGYMPLFAALGPDDRSRIEDAIRTSTESAGQDGVVRLPSTALIAVGTRTRA